MERAEQLSVFAQACSKAVLAVAVTQAGIAATALLSFQNSVPVCFTDDICSA